MSDDSRRRPMSDIINGLVLTIRSKANGYKDIRDLLTDFYDDCRVDGEQLAAQCKCNSFSAFLRSDLMKNYIEFSVDSQDRLCVKAKHDGRTAHIEEQQLISAHALRKKVEREQERMSGEQQNAGTIGRKFYGESDRAPISHYPPTSSNGWYDNDQKKAEDFGKQMSELKYSSNRDDMLNNFNDGRFNNQQYLSSSRDNRFSTGQYQTSGSNTTKRSNSYNVGLNPSDLDFSVSTRNNLERFEHNTRNGYQHSNQKSDYNGYHPSPQRVSPNFEYNRSNGDLMYAQNDMSSHNGNKFGNNGFNGRSKSVAEKPTMTAKNVNMIWCDDDDGDPDKVPDDDVFVVKRNSTTANNSSMNVTKRYYDSDYDGSDEEQDKPNVLESESAVEKNEKFSKPSKWTTRCEGHFTDSDSTISDNESEKPAKPTHEILKNNATTLSSFLSVQSEAETLFDAGKKKLTEDGVMKSDTNGFIENNSTFGNVNKCHGEKWLVEMQRQEERKLNERSLSNNFNLLKPIAMKPIATATCATGDPFSRNNEKYTKTMGHHNTKHTDGDFEPSPSVLRRSASVTSLVSTLASRRRTQALTEEDLLKVSKMVDAIVQYHYPRAILLDDLLVVMEVIEARFISIEQLSDLDHVGFIREYCKNITIVGKQKLNLIWNELE